MQYDWRTYKKGDVYGTQTSTRGEYHANMKAEIGEVLLTAKDGQQPPAREGPGAESSPSLRRTNPAHTWILDFWPPDCETIHVCCLIHSVCGILLRVPSKRTHPLSPGLANVHIAPLLSSFYF